MLPLYAAVAFELLEEQYGNMPPMRTAYCPASVCITRYNIVIVAGTGPIQREVVTKASFIDYCWNPS